MDPLILVLFVAFTLLQVADAVTTIKALKIKGNREVNPVMRWLFERFGVARSLIVMKVVVTGYIFTALDVIPIWALGGLVAFYAWVVINNHKHT